jgi:hypothetical protein
MTTTIDNKDNELFTPDYEAHFQELAGKLREQAALQPDPGDIWTTTIDLLKGDTESIRRGERNRERESALLAEISLLWVQLVFIDLGSLGINPDSARLIVLTRLVVDDVPLNAASKQELMASVVSIVDAAHAAASTETSGEQ